MLSVLPKEMQALHDCETVVLAEGEEKEKKIHP